MRYFSTVYILFFLAATASVATAFQPILAPAVSPKHGRLQDDRSRSPVVLSMSDMTNARNLLYQDQQQAMLRRSVAEQELLESRTTPLETPQLKKGSAASGTGFAAKTSPNQWLAKQQAKLLQKEGVLRIDHALPDEVADALRAYVLEQQAIALDITQKDPSKSRSFYGVEQARAHRCDLQLSLLRGGYKADNNNNDNSDDNVLADALQALLGQNGSLRHLYETLVTKDGEFYELAAVVTDPGSNRQTIHPDLPFQDPAPLYVVFVALQDVTVEMGPTSFLIKTHTAQQNQQFKSMDMAVRDAQLEAADCRLSCMPKGSAVVFDARILHCGNANSSQTSRALFNFSFRNPLVQGNLGYEGSIRPGYGQKMTLSDVADALTSYQTGNKNPFAKYGSGLL